MQLYYARFLVKLPRIELGSSRRAKCKFFYAWSQIFNAKSSWLSAIFFAFGMCEVFKI